MKKEIEKKFLIKTTSFNKSQGISIQQGYLCLDSRRTVRVRIAGNQAYLTIKGETKNNGRDEFEYKIPIEDADCIMKLCAGNIIQKTRHLVEYHNHTFEIDVFQGDNDGLIVAEIELTNENETFEKPDWLGEEVTEDPKYYNSALATNPYKDWK